MPETINLSNIVRSIGIISDTHVGSTFAVWPKSSIYDIEELESDRNYTTLVSKGQRIFQEYWDKFLSVCDEFKVDTILHLGDALQGTNPKEGGRYCITSNIEIQKDAGEALLADLAKGRIYHQFCGTRYHESLDTKVHRDLAKRMENYAKKVYWHGAVANIHFEGTNKTINAAHAATGALVYPSTVLDREAIFLKVAQADGRIPKIDYFVRGHLHYYFHLDYAYIHLIQCPSWMAWFPLKDKVGLYGRSQPDIGGLILLIDKQNRTILLHFLYPTPHIADMVREG